MIKVDLHLHTNLSDGVMNPQQVVEKARKNGCTIISITDHDIARDYSYLSTKYDINIIPGIEFNTSIANMHLLGYGMNNFDSIISKMNELQLYNQNVCIEVIELLKKDGFNISTIKVKDYLQKANLDYNVLDKRKLVKYLIYMGYADSVIETYDKLIGPKQKYYIPNRKISPVEIINLINSCGGLTVLAHPNTLNLNDIKLFELITQLKINGLFGIEVINDKMKLSDTQKYQLMADSLGLLKTVGSDFHNPTTDDIGVVISDVQGEAIFNNLVLKKKKKC